MPSAPSRVTIAAGGTQQREHDSDADHLGVALDAEQAAKALESEAAGTTDPAAAAAAHARASEQRRAASAAYERASRLEPASAEVAYHHASYLRSFGDLLRARQMLSDAALVHAEEPAIASSLGYLLLSERGAAGAAARRHGLQVLTRAAESGAWRGGAPWQHPVEYLSAVPPPPAGGVRPRGAYECLLSPLEGAAADLAAEAAAALERFTVQTEGIARPQGGWRELDLFDVCGLRGGGGARSRAARLRPSETPPDTPQTTKMAPGPLSAPPRHLSAPPRHLDASPTPPRRTTGRPAPPCGPQWRPTRTSRAPSSPLWRRAPPSLRTVDRPTGGWREIDRDRPRSTEIACDRPRSPEIARDRSDPRRRLRSSHHKSMGCPQLAML